MSMGDFKEEKKPSIFGIFAKDNPDPIPEDEPTFNRADACGVGEVEEVGCDSPDYMNVRAKRKELEETTERVKRRTELEQASDSSSDQSLMIPDLSRESFQIRDAMSDRATSVLSIIADKLAEVELAEAKIEDTRAQIDALKVESEYLAQSISLFDKNADSASWADHVDNSDD